MATRNLFVADSISLRHHWLFLGWALVLLVVYLSLTPAPLELGLEHGDKFAHAFAYILLMSWFANLFEGLSERVIFALGFLAMGVALEFLQLWIGYRSFEIADMTSGATGVAIGWILSPPRSPNFLKIAERFWQACK